MLLALDAGNSNITIGAFEGQTSLAAGGFALSMSKPPTSGAC